MGNRQLEISNRQLVIGQNGVSELSGQSGGSWLCGVSWQHGVSWPFRSPDRLECLIWYDQIH